MIRKETLKELIVSFQQSFLIRLKQRELKIPVGSEKIVVLKGVRRSGKSSVLNLTIDKVLRSGISIQHILFLNFDDERIPFETYEFDLILQAYRELYPGINMNEVYFFFDEIQVSNGWEQFVRRIYDNESKHIFITGSNSKLLSSEIATSLRGRTLQYEIFPLSFREFCQFRDIPVNKFNTTGKAKLINSFHQYLALGGFPELVINNFNHSDQILQEYYHVMLFRDLLERYDIKNLSALKYFIRRIMVNITKPTAVNKIFNELKSAGITVGKNSLYEWVDHCETIYLFFGLPKFDPSFIKENASEKKYYCIDNGLQRALSTSLSQNSGALLENALFIWLKTYRNFNTNLSYYKDKKECDFVLSDAAKVTFLLQSCWDISDDGTLNREIDGLTEASEKLKCDNLWLINSEVENDIKRNGKIIKVRPAWKALLEPVTTLQ